MGLDIFLVKLKGRNKDGSLDYKDVSSEYNWDSTRYSIRKQFLEELLFSEISSNVYYDPISFIKLESFEDAIQFRDKLKGAEYDYVDNILSILKADESLYLDISY
tara:strand:- start:1030 stop:1344 length:315 start_codon:yes stop_codon:yes gene_type:complete